MSFSTIFPALRIRLFYVVFALTCSLPGPLLLAQTIRYVRPSALGAGTGASWADASNDLQAMINASSANDQIWIAKGIYTPAATLSMKNGVTIYGGFSGTENQLSERNFIANPTVISGGGNKLVFSNSSLDATAVLDGCTISNGKGSFSVEGGGMFNNNSPVTIRNCVFTNNTASYGGGMMNSNSNPSISNCVFSGNTSTSNSGAGMYNYFSSPTITNCVFTGNNSAANGGAMHNTSTYSLRPSSPTIINCVFTGNYAADRGGAMYNYSYSYPTIINSIIYGNTARLTANIYNYSPAAPVITYSDIQGGNAGTGNLNVDPLFANAASPAGSDGIWMTADDGLALSPCSPVINMGTTPASALPADILANARVGAYDLGAYEYQGISQNLAPATGSQSASVTQTQNGTTIYSLCSDGLIATVTSNGPSPIAGATTAKVWVETTQPAQFVKRHYQITPDDNASAATGRITLYFTQSEFDEFNDNASNTVKLPIDGTDAVGVSHIVVEKRPGVSSDGTGLPGTYTGTPETIAQPYLDIVWNAALSRWEISLDVVGFSGFFVKTTLSALPLRLIRFTAAREAESNLLSWMTANEVNTLQFEVQRSSDAKVFEKIGAVDAAGSGNHSYSLSDRTPLDGTNYYRLKMLDLDGSYTYSKITSLTRYGIGFYAYPNPTKDKVTIQGTNISGKATLFDMQGRILQQIEVTQNSLTLDFSKYASGVYLLKTGDRIQKIIKE